MVIGTFNLCPRCGTSTNTCPRCGTHTTFSQVYSPTTNYGYYTSTFYINNNDTKKIKTKSELNRDKLNGINNLNSRTRKLTRWR